VTAAGTAPTVPGTAAPSASILVTPDGSQRLQDPPPIIFEPSKLPLEGNKDDKEEDGDKKRKRSSGSGGTPAQRQVETTRDYGI